MAIVIEDLQMEQLAQQARLANEASQRVGNGHPAHLNMGDCAVYALAKLLDESLLFVGNDFSQTDIKSC